MGKSAKSGVYLPYILHLAPSDLSGHNTCPLATIGCKKSCLNTSGMGVFSNVQLARIAKTKYFFDNRQAFYTDLIKEVARAERKAIKEGKQLTMRLNGTSDLQWEVYKMQDGKTIFELFPNVTFYDYTKIPNRKSNPFPNYSLTFSAADNNDAHVATALDKGMNIAVVFRRDLPSTWNGRTVIDGDVDDLRFLDPANVIVGLRAKGKAKYDKTGFVKD